MAMMRKLLALAVLLACGRPVVFATLELTAQALVTPERLATHLGLALILFCALIWTEGPRLMALSDSLLDAELAKITSRFVG